MSLYAHLCIIAIAASSASASTCPWYTTYYEPDGACYAFFKSLNNWTYAEQQCQRLGGNLASVHDADANTFMQKYSDVYPLHWLGGRKVDGAWSWTDGCPWDYTNWARGQPTASGECLAMTVRDGRWYSDRCNQPTTYICRIPDVVTDYTAPPLVPTLEPSHPTSDKCPEDWQYIASTNLCYRLLSDVPDWQAAKKACNDVGAALVSIPDNATNAHILSYARHVNPKGNTAVTIGLNNVLQPDGRTWRWEWVDGSKGTFTNWEYGNPVEADPNAPTQNCAAMSLPDGQWFSDYKWNLATPMCERRPNY